MSFFPLFKNGDVCISILHPPVDDPQSGELPSERWNPTQNVRLALSFVASPHMSLLGRYLPSLSSLDHFNNWPSHIPFSHDVCLQSTLWRRSQGLTWSSYLCLMDLCQGINLSVNNLLRASISLI